MNVQAVQETARGPVRETFTDGIYNHEMKHDHQGGAVTRGVGQALGPGWLLQHGAVWLQTDKKPEAAAGEAGGGHGPGRLNQELMSLCTRPERHSSSASILRAPVLFFTLLLVAPNP